jgi:hypothetical protein
VKDGDVQQGSLDRTWRTVRSTVKGLMIVFNDSIFMFQLALEMYSVL